MGVADGVAMGAADGVAVGVAVGVGTGPAWATADQAVTASATITRDPTTKRRIVAFDRTNDQMNGKSAMNRVALYVRVSTTDQLFDSVGFSA